MQGIVSANAVADRKRPTGSTSLSSSQNYLTDVGAYIASAGPYGTLDQDGNVFQWNDTPISGSNRGLRGGAWDIYYGALASGYRYNATPESTASYIGFRVARVTNASSLHDGDFANSLHDGDFNRDGHVNAADILAMEQALSDLPGYETAKGLTPAQMLLVDDLNGDDVVNNADLQSLLNLLKAGGGSTNPVPEPSTFVLAVLAAVMLGIFRRVSQSAERF